VKPHLSEDDRLIEERVRRAERELQDAMQIARRSKQPRANEVFRSLSRLASALNDVGTVASKYAEDDPDLMPEEERANRWREARKREKK
jgi:hypothetical protein